MVNRNMPTMNIPTKNIPTKNVPTGKLPTKRNSKTLARTTGSREILKNLNASEANYRPK